MSGSQNINDVLVLLKETEGPVIFSKQEFLALLRLLEASAGLIDQLENRLADLTACGEKIIPFKRAANIHLVTSNQNPGGGDAA